MITPKSSKKEQIVKLIALEKQLKTLLCSIQGLKTKTLTSKRSDLVTAVDDVVTSQQSKTISQWLRQPGMNTHNNNFSCNNCLLIC